jgi:hypothetical protein
MSAILIAVPILGAAAAVGVGTYLFSGNKSGSSGNNVLPQYQDGNWEPRPSEFAAGIRRHKKSGKRGHPKGKGTKKHRSKKHK